MHVVLGQIHKQDYELDFSLIPSENKLMGYCFKINFYSDFNHF